MAKITAFVYFFGLIAGLISSLPLDGEPHDFLADTGVELKHLANVLMSPHVVVCDQTEDHNEEDHVLDGHVLEHMAEGAIGAIGKGVLAAKKGAYVAGRIFLKPIAIVTGLNLKMFGAGLAGAGKLVAGTGAGIAKAGTVVKYAGLGHIGLGASAIGWGLDRTTIDSHFHDDQQKLHATIPAVPVVVVEHTYHTVDETVDTTKY